jgi:hypothetical protein
MALGGNQLKQHLVEFIRGVGVVTNGVVDPTSLNGPWTWVVPEGVARLTLDACGGGQGGFSGAEFSVGVTSMGGGSAGSPGGAILGGQVAVRPLSELTVTLGAGGPPGAAVNAWLSPYGGDTTIAGSLAGNLSPTGLNTILIYGGGHYPGADPTASSGGQGLGSNGATGNGSEPAGGVWDAASALGGVVLGGRDTLPGPSGGAGNVSGAVAGFRGGRVVQWIANTTNRFGLAMQDHPQGTTDGTISRGGGGSAQPGLFGRSGLGGSNSAGESSPSYGGGGGGGAGGFAGGSGGDGYVRFTYWSAD